MHTKSNTHAPYGITLMRTLHTVIYGLAHAPVSARAKMIDLLPHLDSLVVRCSAVQGTSRKGGRAPLWTLPPRC